MRVIIVFSVLGLTMFGAWLDFSPSKRYLGDFTRLKDATSVVNAVQQFDAMFMAYPEYREVKRIEYARLKKNFNTPLLKESRIRIEKLLLAKTDDEQYLTRMVLRSSILFSIIDESMLDPRTPSKEEVAEAVALLEVNTTMLIGN